MDIQLLSNLNRVKALTIIDSNINDKLLLVAISEAQEVDLLHILGTSLLNKLKIVANTYNDSNTDDYTILIDKLQYFIAYATQVRLLESTFIKVSNMGVVQLQDTNVQSITIEDLFKVRRMFIGKRDEQAKLLQQFLTENILKYKELNDNNLYNTKSNTQSSTTSGLYLGGVRGR